MQITVSPRDRPLQLREHPRGSGRAALACISARIWSVPLNAAARTRAGTFPRGRPSFENTDLWSPAPGSKPAKQTVRDRVNARRPSAEPSSPYGGRPRTAGRSRRPRRLAREAQQPAVPSPDRPESQPHCGVQQPAAEQPRFASIAIASTNSPNRMLDATPIKLFTAAIGTITAAGVFFLACGR